MNKTCEHVGKEHPMNFQCGSCEDTADDCNCNYSPMVFCEKYQEFINIDVGTVVSKWYEQNPDKDLQLEKLKIQGHISDYKSS